MPPETTIVVSGGLFLSNETVDMLETAIQGLSRSAFGATAYIVFCDVNNLSNNRLQSIDLYVAWTQNPIYILMLTKNDIKIIKDTINDTVSSGKTALTQTIANLLKKTRNPKFRPDYWAGYEKFLTMIEAYPDEFRIVEHSPKKKEIVIVAKGDDCDNANRQSVKNLSFEGYLNEYLNDDLIADTCQRFKLTVDMQKPCIIKSYLKYRYYKAIADNKVLEHRGARMFHTGWFYNGTDPIFCIWGDGNHQTHAFNFVRQSGNDGRELRKLFNNRVPEQLTFPIMKFNHEWDIEPEFGHIFVDRICCQ